MPSSGTERRARFLHPNRYRIDREWRRYEGTPQRDLFREIRSRMLTSLPAPAGWTLEVGPGPGRFSAEVGQGSVRRVLLDLSKEMLHEAARRWPAPFPAPYSVRGDANVPPFREGQFSEVVAYGNSVGFAGAEAERLLSGLVRLVAEKGWLHLELSAGSGTRSRYLRRLPVTALPRLLEAPPRLLEARVLREGFDALPETRAEQHGFHRFAPEWTTQELERAGLVVERVQAVAPALGSDAERVSVVSRNRRAWSHLLELEESLGRGMTALPGASAYLVAARRPGAPASKSHRTG